MLQFFLRVSFVCIDTHILLSINKYMDIKYWFYRVRWGTIELLYAHHVRGPLDVLRESWEATDKPDKKNILSYVHLQKTTAIARENLLQTQKRQKEC